MVNSEERSPTHLVVFAHGFLGIPQTTKFASDQLGNKYKSDVIILNSSCNQSWLSGTTQGVDKSGERLADEVSQFIAKNPTLEKISFVGVSMGGLIARYAFALLYDTENARIGGLIPQNFITFVTPHLGTRYGNIPWITEQYISKFPLVKSSTDHMFYRDALYDPKNLKTHQPISNHEELVKYPSVQKEIPLLLEMSLPGGIFFESLKSFKYRGLYTNVEKDHRVSYQSGAIWPFKLMGEAWKRPFVYLQNHPNIIDHKEENFTWSPSDDEIIKVNEANMEVLYPLDSPEWETAKNLNKLKWTRYNCHFNGWFASVLNHSVIHVGFETIHSGGKNVVDHFVNNFTV